MPGDFCSAAWPMPSSIRIPATKRAPRPACCWPIAWANPSSPTRKESVSRYSCGIICRRDLGSLTDRRQKLCHRVAKMREAHLRLFDIRMPALLPFEVKPALIAGTGEQRQRLEYRNIPLAELHEAIAEPRGRIDA